MLRCSVFKSSTCITVTVCLSFCLLLSICTAAISNNRSFTIDYKNDVFLKDGQPFQYISGSFHYSRVPSIYWEDRLSKMKSAGLNAVQTYVMWNYHQPNGPNDSEFSGDQDLELFLTLAAKYDLLAIVRAGPYVCGEWDFGGLPAWLLQQNASMVLRSRDPQYLSAVDKWMGVYLLPRLKKHLYSSGGNVIMVQLENEYGSYPTCDSVYVHHLYDLGRKYLGNDVILFTTDGNSYGYLKCGGLLDTRFFATVDFGAGSTNNLTAAFADLRRYQPHGPLVNSEYYTGWLDHWGQPHQQVDATAVVKGLTAMLHYKVNVNMYMIIGGTNFEYWNGANSPSYSPQPTSYDYDAPLTENGDTSTKYHLVRSAIQNFTKQKLPDVPSNVSVIQYDDVQMQSAVHLLQIVDLLTVNFTRNLPLPVSMEAMGLFSGFALYETRLTVNQSGTSKLQLTLDSVKDYCLVYWRLVHPDSSVSLPIYAGSVSWLSKSRNLTISVNADSPHSTISLLFLVENSGHVNYGANMQSDIKGIIGPLKINGTVQFGWNSTALDVSKITTTLTTPVTLSNTNLYDLTQVTYPTQGTFYFGHLSVPLSMEVQDTFVKLDSWCKGQIFVNSYNLGRYWPCQGPQVTLYLPKTHIQSQGRTASFFLLELADSSCGDTGHVCALQFTTSPILNGHHQPHNDTEHYHRQSQIHYNSRESPVRSLL